MDFGGLKAVKQMLVDTFDHKLVLAEDDPEKELLCSLAGLDVASVVILPGVGCELFAYHAWVKAAEILAEINPHVKVLSCEVREHGANSAIYKAAIYE